MRKDQRLTRATDFAAVRRIRRSWSDGLLALKARPNDLKVSRFGFSVGRRLGKAVVRNQIKRRLREAAGLARAEGGWDLVVIVRKQASSSDFHQLSRSLTMLLRRAGVLAGSDQNLCRSSS